MARLAVAGGTTTLFATPHLTNAREFAKAGFVAEMVASLQVELETANLPLRLIPGGEIYPGDAIMTALANDAPLTLGGSRYLLLDLPFMSLPMGLGALIFSLQTHGITPILAHPERVTPFQRDLQQLEAFVQRGALVQVTGLSLLGGFGHEAQATAHSLLRLRWAHFLASDAHSPRRRNTDLDEAAKVLGELVEPDFAHLLTEGNGARVLANESIATDPLPYTPAPAKKTGFRWPWAR